MDDSEPNSPQDGEYESTTRSGTRFKPPKPTGSRSRWAVASNMERLFWLVSVPVRAIICVSNVTVFFLTYVGFMLPVLWARPLWPRFYWYYEGKLYLWLQAFIGYWGYTADYDVYEYGDDITHYGDSERVLMMVNHQSTADVPTLFAILQNKGVATRKTIWLMDIMFKWTPFGIVGRMHGDYFIQQGKATRDLELQRLKEHLGRVFWERDRRWIIFFPEGGFFYKRVESSQLYAKKNGYPHLEHTTLPRLGAVKAILEEIGARDDDDSPMPRNSSGLKLLKDAFGAIREKKYVKETRPPIKYLLDVTIAYPNGHPLSLGTLVFGSREKCDIAVNYKMYNSTDVPFDDDDKLRDWMYKVYEEKDKILDNYYKYGEFHPGESGHLIVFPWSKIIGQYAFWLISFFVQLKVYSWVILTVYRFFYPL
jgi:lysophosphatidylglycerol acyltransferase 1